MLLVPPSPFILSIKNKRIPKNLSTWSFAISCLFHCECQLSGCSHQLFDTALVNIVDTWALSNSSKFARMSTTIALSNTSDFNLPQYINNFKMISINICWCTECTQTSNLFLVTSHSSPIRLTLTFPASTAKRKKIIYNRTIHAASINNRTALTRSLTHSHHRSYRTRIYINYPLQPCHL